MALRAQGNSEDLRRFREALERFWLRELDVVSKGYREIERTLAQLDDAERHWRYEMERRDPREYAWRQAQENLQAIRGWKMVVHDSAAMYSRRATCLRQTLQSDVPRGCQFLNNRILALEAYRRTVLASSVSLGTGITGAILAAAAVSSVRRARTTIRSHAGIAGEEVSVHVLSEAFGLERIPEMSGQYGFREVYRVPGMANALTVVARTPSEVASAGEPRSISIRIRRLVQAMDMPALIFVVVVTDLSMQRGDIYHKRDDGTWELPARSPGRK